MAEDKRNQVQLPHHLVLEDRRALTVSGVSDVDSFDELTVVIYTEMGELTVKGQGLHINRLNVETGDLTLEGTIDSLTYAEVHSRSGGFFRAIVQVKGPAYGDDKRPAVERAFSVLRHGVSAGGVL